jgi:hypothetical protein
MAGGGSSSKLSLNSYAFFLSFILTRHVGSQRASSSSSLTPTTTTVLTGKRRTSHSLAKTTEYRHWAGAKVRCEHTRHRKGLPLPYPAIGRNGTVQKAVDQPWESRIQGTPSQDLVHRRMSGRDMLFMFNEDEDDDEDEDDGLDDMDVMFQEKKPDANAADTERPSRGLGMMSRYHSILVKRSMVTLIERRPSTR